MKKMVGLAKDLLGANADASEALKMLTAFNEMYDRNQEMAMKSGNMDITLESTLKSYVDQLYRENTPRVKKLSFTNVNDIVDVINNIKYGRRDELLTKRMLSSLDFIGYGTYALAPNCRGDIQVNIHLIGKDGAIESFVATGIPDKVMLDIAIQMFDKFQKTQFPADVKIGKKTLTIIGGLNGSIDWASSPLLAESFCESLDARLPTKLELEVINGYGTYSGGVSFDNRTFVLPDGHIYVSLFKSAPVRQLSEVNEKEFNYYCVK
jgi:hypothetical protein